MNSGRSLQQIIEDSPGEKLNFTAFDASFNESANPGCDMLTDLAEMLERNQQKGSPYAMQLLEKIQSVLQNDKLFALTVERDGRNEQKEIIKVALDVLERRLKSLPIIVNATKTMVEATYPLIKARREMLDPNPFLVTSR